LFDHLVGIINVEELDINFDSSRIGNLLNKSMEEFMFTKNEMEKKIDINK